jgi:predicted alpha/beta hydrolase family esterase
MITFHVSAEHVKAQKRKTIYGMLILAALTLGCISMLIKAKELSGMIFPTIGIFLFAPPIRRSYKTIKEGAASFPIVEIDERTNKVIVTHKDISVVVDVTRNENVRLQYKSGRLVSAIVKTLSGEVMRFEGYENLEALVAFLESVTPKENITRANFYHR